MEFKLLRGMLPEYDETINYSIELGEDKLHLNPLIGKTIKIHFNNTKNCIACGREIKKNTFNQGYCYPCFRDLAENDLCIVSPHLCHFHEGTCRDEDFAKKHCFSDHYVYLAISSDVKVGITRKVTLKKRWMDQGAIEAMPIALVPDRRTAGLMEHSLKEYLNDKTNWRKMLKGESTGDLSISLSVVREVIADEFKDYLIEETILKINYPHATPPKLKSLNLEKSPILESKLLGVKGQYLILEEGVLNIRKHRGFNCTIEAAE
ncbi:DUF2797 domain-containing protein [Alkalicella caledoniensis]|uniref:DUF2797 domain-containing protein n=1 Tax=Alkalicella caledoniensis TaxID=2731377 RepID=A0A7G9W565_ALKCA|nr:DUF2797 domain-containing protein [Alkalicella caledoniensis]QNO13827.1 DUF2797 domain-containing protein [Alkalicella caledoniensis]